MLGYSRGWDAGMVVVQKSKQVDAFKMDTHILRAGFLYTIMLLFYRATWCFVSALLHIKTFVDQTP